MTQEKKGFLQIIADKGADSTRLMKKLSKFLYACVISCRGNLQRSFEQKRFA
jgi:aspartyl/asparaginyl-tRNA synthetase